MSLTWIICGAGRGVGKTTLALQLCELLPESVYVKCGCGQSKPDRPGMFFNHPDQVKTFIGSDANANQHIIVESNTLAKSACGDMIIFIDGIAGKTNFRNDVEILRSTAHIKISPDTTPADWKKVLSAKVGSKSTRDAVCDFLVAQKQFLFGSTPTVRSKIWFEAGGALIFGNGLARLLENIARSGTLQDAAKTSDMSYRYAWNLIRMAEHHFGKVLIERHAGGQSGGSSTLSSEGMHLLNIFKQLNKEVAAFTDEKFAQLYAGAKSHV
jgi:molybdate transport system regulatory protein